MGCGSSKGKAEGEGSGSAEIEFKDTGCHSMDRFFESAKKVLDAVKDLTGPLGEQKEKLFESTGFYEVPGAGKDFLIYNSKEVKHAVLGMFVCFVASVNVSLP